jgi:hypothetical protein
MSTAYETLRYEVAGSGVATITLDQPDTRNALSDQLLGELIAAFEAARDDDADKNRLCPPTAYPSASVDWISVFESGFRVITQMLQEPDLAAWLASCRLNTTRGMNDHMGDPGMQAALGRWFEHMEPALANAPRLRALSVG